MILKWMQDERENSVGTYEALDGTLVGSAAIERNPSTGFTVMVTRDENGNIYGHAQNSQQTIDEERDFAMRSIFLFDKIYGSRKEMNKMEEIIFKSVDSRTGRRDEWVHPGELYEVAKCFDYKGEQETLLEVANKMVEKGMLISEPVGSLQTMHYKINREAKA